jgi:hypothetical protein
MLPLAGVLSELRDNVRLRVGVGLILASGWLYALLVWDDVLAARRAELQQVRGEAERLRPFEKTDAVWKERAAEARQLNAGLQSYLWEARSRSLAEAAFRDWVQARAQSSGLKVRELTVRAVDAPVAAGAEPAPAGTAGGGTAASAAAGPLTVRARLVTGFVPSQLAALLLQLHEQPRHLGIQRLQIRNAPAGQEAVAELEIQVLFAIREGRT